MNLNRVRLDNWKCYSEEDLSLKTGASVVSGRNGSGKTTILEACFFALYGSDSLDKGETLQSPITTGKDEMTVELWFSHNGTEYHIRRSVGPRGQDALIEGTNIHREGATDVDEFIRELLNMDAEAYTNCSYVRQDEVKALIQADADERAETIDGLLQLGKLEDYKERAKLRKRGAKRVRDKKEAEVKSLSEQIEEHEEDDAAGQLESIESDLETLTDEIGSLEEKRDEVKDDVSDAEDILDEYEEQQTRLKEIESKLDTVVGKIEDAKSEREELKTEIEDHRNHAESLKESLNSNLGDFEAVDADSFEAFYDASASDDPDERYTVAPITTAINEVKEERDSIGDEIEDLAVETEQKRSKAESLQKEATQYENRVGEERDTISELNSELTETRDKRDSLKNEYEETEADIEAKRSEFDDVDVTPDSVSERREQIQETLSDLRDEMGNVQTEKAKVKQSVEEAEELLDEGKCPECGQDVEDSPHVDNLSEDQDRLEKLSEQLSQLQEKREELEDTLSELEDLESVSDNISRLKDTLSHTSERISDVESEIDSYTDDIQAAKENISEFESEAEEARDSAEEYQQRVSKLESEKEELEGEKATLDDRISRLETLQDTVEHIANAESKAIRKEGRVERLSDTLDERRTRRNELEDKRDEIQDAFNDKRIQSARDQKADAQETLAQLEKELEQLRSERDELQNKQGALQNSIEELQKLRGRREDAKGMYERTESYVTELADLTRMYDELQTDLRRQNVAKLEQILNKIFGELYQNDSYARIELSTEYEMTVYQKDGEELDPSQLSGGEKVLFNLSLRCAIYKLLTEGIEGETPMPPLILDEPTATLDSGHSDKIAHIVDLVLDLGVEQMLIISHDDEVVNNADHLIKTSKNPTTNRSSASYDSSTGQDDGMVAL